MVWLHIVFFFSSFKTFYCYLLSFSIENIEKTVRIFLFNTLSKICFDITFSLFFSILLLFPRCLDLLEIVEKWIRIFLLIGSYKKISPSLINYFQNNMFLILRNNLIIALSLTTVRMALVTTSIVVVRAFFYF